MEINTINLVGRAGREPDVRYFESGSIVANFNFDFLIFFNKNTY